MSLLKYFSVLSPYDCSYCLLFLVKQSMQSSSTVTLILNDVSVN